MPNTRYTVEYTCNRLSPEWDKFVDKANGAIFQTTVWANMVKQNPYWVNVVKEIDVIEWYLIAIREKENRSIVAGCTVFVEKFPRYGKVGYIWRGPCFINHSDELISLLIAEIKQFSKKHRLTYTVVSFNYTENSLLDLFTSNGFFRKNKNLPPFTYLMRMEATLIVDIKPSLDDIFNQMKKDKKKNIRKGLNYPINVRTGTKVDLETVCQLMLKTKELRNAAESAFSLDELRSMWDYLTPTGRMELLIAEVGGKAICSQICFVTGNTFQCIFWGWNGEYKEYEIVSVFNWKVIEYAKEKGFEYFDFVEISIECYRAIMEDRVDDRIKNHLFFGPTFQKMRYGGTLAEYLPMHIYYPNIFKKTLIETMLAFKKSRLWKLIRR